MKYCTIKSLLSLLLTLAISFSQNNTQEISINQISPDQITDTLINSEFERWRKQTKRCYSSDSEILYRRQIFADNYRMIIAHNNDKTQTYTMALNNFADMEFIEFTNRYLTPNLGKNIDISSIRNTKEDEDARNQDIQDSESHLCTQQQENSFTKNRVLPMPPPPYCDWRPQAVNPVISAVSYAASVTGMAEGFHKIYTTVLLKFCEQQILDCCGYFGFGIAGVCSWHYQAVNYVAKFGLLTCTQYYSLPVNPLGACRLLTSSNGFRFNQKIYPLPSVLTTFKWSVCKQPFSATINFTVGMLYYHSGIYTGPCSSSLASANYFILLVGYSTQGNWYVKTSISPSWGQFGYIYIPQAANKCGILNYGLRAWHL